MITETATRSKKRSGSTVAWAVRDTLTIAHRDILLLIRIPTSLVFAIIQPIMFVLLFRYVFGSSIRPTILINGHLIHISYVNYLIPGILVQTTIFGAISTAIGLSEDLQKGVIERFRALPMSRMAVLGGRTISDLIRNVFVLIIITGIGFAVGFRPHGGISSYVQGSLLMLFFAYCLSWGFAYLGLKAPNSETAQAMAFPIIFPLTFASNIFVSTGGMPTWLRDFANNQPVSQTAGAVRSLMLGQNLGFHTWIAWVWGLGALLVLAPLATRAYRRVA